MTTPLRYIPEDAKLWTNAEGEPIAVVEVTIRCILGMHLLTPKRRHVSLLLGVIGRALAELDFELYGYAFLSNHGSLLIGVRDAGHLARIMEYIHGNIARELGRPEHSDWPGRFWSRRGRAILVLSDETLIARMRYLLSNSTKEHLVKHPTRWPGAHCARALCHGTTDVGLWIDRTALFRARRREGSQVKESDFHTHYPLTRSKLPCWRDLGDDEYRQEMRDMCSHIATEAAAARADTGGAVLGVKAILRMEPHYRPPDMKRSPAPLVHCSDRTTRKRFRRAYLRFVAAYREATDALRAGIVSAGFPSGGVPPGCRCGPDTG